MGTTAVEFLKERNPPRGCTPITYSVRETIFMSSESFPASGTRVQSEVFAVHGADPEILAFAMAKYSRSSLSMRESLTEISAQRAEQFLNTFYFQYGHRSIADLAHIAFAVERLSLLAAIVLVDEARWDGQERSTRYRNFLESGWYFLNLERILPRRSFTRKPSRTCSAPTGGFPLRFLNSFAAASLGLRL